MMPAMNRDEALRASKSDDWVTRIMAIPYIGEHFDDECRRAMILLMADREDLAVCYEAGRYLVSRNDLESAETLFTGLAISDEAQRFRTLREVQGAHVTGQFDIERFSSSIYGGPNFLARSGLRDVLRWLNLDANPPSS